MEAPDEERAIIAAVETLRAQADIWREYQNRGELDGPQIDVDDVFEIAAALPEQGFIWFPMEEN